MNEVLEKENHGTFMLGLEHCCRVCTISLHPRTVILLKCVFLAFALNLCADRILTISPVHKLTSAC